LVEDLEFLRGIAFKNIASWLLGFITSPTLEVEVSCKLKAVYWGYGVYSLGDLW